MNGFSHVILYNRLYVAKMAPTRFLVPCAAPPSRGRLYFPSLFATALMNKIHSEMLHDFLRYVKKGFWLSWDTNAWNPASMLRGSPAYMERPCVLADDPDKDLADSQHSLQTYEYTRLQGIPASAI